MNDSNYEAVSRYVSGDTTEIMQKSKVGGLLTWYYSTASASRFATVKADLIVKGITPVIEVNGIDDKQRPVHCMSWTRTILPASVVAPVKH